MKTVVRGGKPMKHGAPGSPEALLLGGPVAARKELAAMASPVTHVSPDDPPFPIVHGDQDTTVPIRQSELLYDALQKAGVDAVFVPVPGAGHGFAQTPAVMRTVEEFFDKYLNKVRPSRTRQPLVNRNVRRHRHLERRMA